MPNSNVPEERISIFAGVNGYLDKLKLDDIKEFEGKYLEDLRANYPEYLKEIKDKKVISEELKEKLKEYFGAFSQEFLTKEKAA